MESMISRIRKINYYHKLTKENTCPECGCALMLPYFPNGFDSVGITQCSVCNYSRQIKFKSSNKNKGINNGIFNEL